MSKRYRPYWKGYLKFGMATIAVSAYSGTESQAGVTFHHIHRPTGKRINLEKRVDGKKIENDDVVRGVEVNETTYIVVEDAELSALKLDSHRTISLDTFVDPKSIDPRYFVKPYYLVPSAAFAQEGFATVRAAMARTNKVAIAQLTIAGREWLVMVSPHGQGMLMTTLRYADELRMEEDFFGDLPATKPDKELTALAAKFIFDRSDDYDPARYVDHYKAAVRELIDSKISGNQLLLTPAKVDLPNVIDFSDALKMSAKEAKPKKRASR